MSPAFRASVITTGLLAFIALAGVLGACGGGVEQLSPTTAPAVSPSPSTDTGTPRPSLPPLVLEASVTPESVAVGETATVTWRTAADALIGFEVVDAAGKTLVQSTAHAGTDGTATYDVTAAEPKGTWTVSAAAGRSIIDLLILQANPLPGPNTADVTLEVR